MTKCHKQLNRYFELQDKHDKSRFYNVKELGERLDLKKEIMATLKQFEQSLKVAGKN